MNNSRFSNPGSSLASRRGFVRRVALATTFLTVRGVFAEALSRRTAPVEEGPFYPPKLPLDTDNDLLMVNDSLTPAVGEVTHLSGRLLDSRGDPVRHATVEVWSVDGRGIYLADRANEAKYDAHFQGFGRFLTGSTGEYYFRTIKPVAYGGRPAPHIHFKIKRPGQDPWTTQLFVRGDPGNPKDRIWRDIGDEQARASVTVDFVPLRDSRAGELGARFDIVLALTPSA